ncbi:hypothetical protein AB0J83_15725 [Actinoplanes sp. NPDC049596]|uniref:hypothetical protein n=1 Tax=unclassified Actinoplanes TaxID=2626549 RepID=UPI00344A9E91
MRGQMSLFSRAETAAMRDRTKAKNYSTEREEFRRAQKKRRDWGLAQRYAEKQRRMYGSVEAARAEFARCARERRIPKPPADWTVAAEPAAANPTTTQAPLTSEPGTPQPATLTPTSPAPATIEPMVSEPAPQLPAAMEPAAPAAAPHLPAATEPVVPVPAPRLPAATEPVVPAPRLPTAIEPTPAVTASAPGGSVTPISGSIAEVITPVPALPHDQVDRTRSDARRAIAYPVEPPRAYWSYLATRKRINDGRLAATERFRCSRPRHRKDASQPNRISCLAPDRHKQFHREKRQPQGPA